MLCKRRTIRAALSEDDAEWKLKMTTPSSSKNIQRSEADTKSLHLHVDELRWINKSGKNISNMDHSFMEIYSPHEENNDEKQMLSLQMILSVSSFHRNRNSYNFYMELRKSSSSRWIIKSVI